MTSFPGWILFFVLLKRALAQTEEVQCTVRPVQSSHPVQGLLERFEAGPGCVARERGSKETHVIAVGRASNSPENKVTVMLKPLSLSPGPVRETHLLLCSKLPVVWWLEAERLPPDLTVLVQVSSHSTVQSDTVRLRVQLLRSLPFHPRALHRWALRHHGNISSLTHTTHSNRVYLKLGQDFSDQNQSAVCQLQSLFLSHNYVTSDLQPQEVQGCTHLAADASGPEVHIIKLHSAGSGLCGSVQVEVVVSLVPLVKSKAHDVVLILSSSVPVNWAILAKGVQGRIGIHSSNSISPPFPPEPNLTVSSRLNPDLSTVSDLLAWAQKRGFSTVTSYTEADLANRFVIHLTRPGTEVTPPVLRPPWAEERRLRHWLSDTGKAGDRESFTVQCEGGRLIVTVDQHILQSSSVPVSAVTLRDPMCQAQSNGSHFLLVFPVISCETEGALLGQSGRVQYKNTVFLWRDEPQTFLALNETEMKSKAPLSIHFSCLASIPTLSSNHDADSETPPSVPVPWTLEGPKQDEEIRLPTSRHRSGPVLTMELFVTEAYEKRQISPCVITAEHRVYTEISIKGPLVDVIEVKSCVISPQSDPKKSPFWSVIWDGCSSDDSLILSTITTHEEEPEDKDDSTQTTEVVKKDKEGLSLDRKIERRQQEPTKGTQKSSRSVRAEEQVQLMRFSFIMQPVYNESVQFLHCSLLLCDSDMTQGVFTTVKRECTPRRRIPPLVSKTARHQCEIRNLSRPMVVTQPISSLATKLLRSPDGQRFKRLSVSSVASPGSEHSSSVVEMGPLLGIVFAAFVMGICLMGGLWYIYSHTAPYQRSLGEDLTDETQGGQNLFNPSSVSIQSTSSV